MRNLAFFLLVFFAGAKALASIDPYQFDSDAQRERYQHFIDTMRCPKCQNESLAGSNAPIAADLRHELQRLIRDGKSDREITAYMVSRYGDYILYKPPFDKKTAALWLAPIVFFGAGMVVLITVARRRAAATATPELTAAEQEKLRQLLREESASPTLNNISERDDPGAKQT